MDEIQFRKEKHITYWLRCLKTYLPQAYTSTDPNRMSLAFFIVSSIDILGALDTHVSDEERKGYIDWIYRCQHPEGGFRGFPGTDFGEHSAPENAVWDPANIPATYFALAMLLILRDDLKRVKREECLAWVHNMQRPDGSFGQTIGPGSAIQGGFDTRFGYASLCIRKFLRRKGDTGPDIDVDSLIKNIFCLQTYDGGYSDEPFHEAHGGYTYCSVAALSTADRLHDGIRNRELLLHFLISRQTVSLLPDDEFDNDNNNNNINDDTINYMSHSRDTQEATHDEKTELNEIQPHLRDNSLSFVGLNGRPNKYADTCYCWWIGATLKTLGSLQLIDTDKVKTFLLTKTQHPIGGFGKNQGDLPDIYHSYLGLASLSIFGQPGLKPMDANACISLESLNYSESLKSF